MPAFKNTTEHPLRFNLDGNDPDGVVVVAPGETFTLTKNQTYIVGTQIGAKQVERVVVEGEKVEDETPLDGTTTDPADRRTFRTDRRK